MRPGNVRELAAVQSGQADIRYHQIEALRASTIAAADEAGLSLLGLDPDTVAFTHPGGIA
jgi:hypothetical protein